MDGGVDGVHPIHSSRVVPLDLMPAEPRLGTGNMGPHQGCIFHRKTKVSHVFGVTQGCPVVDGPGMGENINLSHTFPTTGEHTTRATEFCSQVYNGRRWVSAAKSSTGGAMGMGSDGLEVDLHQITLL